MTLNLVLEVHGWHVATFLSLLLCWRSVRLSRHGDDATAGAAGTMVIAVWIGYWIARWLP